MPNPGTFTSLSRSFWAKTAVASGQRPAFGLSVVQHSIDIASVIVPLAKQIVAPSVLERLTKTFGTVDLDTVLQFVALLHDVGKISPQFQEKVPEACVHIPIELRCGISKDDAKLRHNFISGNTFKHWLRLRATTSSRRSLRTWEQVLSGHHGRFASMQQVSYVETKTATANSFGKDANEEYFKLRINFIDQAAEYLDVDQDLVDYLANCVLPTADLVLIESILIVADWVASGGFPLLPDNRTLDEAANVARTRAVLNKFDLGGDWEPIPVHASSFAIRAGLPPSSQMNDLQLEACRVADVVDSPQLILIEDQTGGGKTEAALAMADTIGKI